MILTVEFFVGIVAVFIFGSFLAIGFEKILHITLRKP